ncbi:MAG TPA: peptidylprolyl isomerase [Tepidisphaeraceae bacterium]|nr:peptidylprolyl isomerase [Tepidisphaeraceae bacterium]
MNKRTIRYVLAATAAAVVSAPLIWQARSAQSAAPAPAPQQSSLPQADLPPATRPAPMDPDKVLATAGDVRVTGADFEAVIANVPPQYSARLNDPTVRKGLLDQIIRVKLLAEEAERRKIDQKPDVRRQLEMQREQTLTNALAQDLQGSSDATDHAYFDANKSSFDDVKARHILIRTPESPVPVGAGKKPLSDADAKAKAEQIEAQLKKGGDFAAIAKAESDDVSSGVKGGDLGTFSPWKMDPTFSKATLGLQKNQISEPVKTQFGYHIIQLLDDTPKSYDQAKGEVGQARWSALVSELGEKNKTQYNPEFFGNAPATRPVGTGQAQPVVSQNKG